jgi:hypothetical protein
MDKVQLPEKPLSQWGHLLFDTPGDQSLSPEELLCRPKHPLPLRLAFWLDFFLTAGQERLREKWMLLSEEDQQALGLEILKCYLTQPLFIRLFPGEKSITRNPSFISGRSEKLLQVEVDSGTTPERRFFYPLAHRRLWPALLSVLKEELFTSLVIYKGLQPALVLASSSRLAAIRERAETLVSFFSTKQVLDLSPEAVTKEKIFSEEEGTPSIPAIPEETRKVILSSEVEEPDQSIPEKADVAPPPSASSPKKKKKKTINHQLELF